MREITHVLGYTHYGLSTLFNKNEAAEASLKIPYRVWEGGTGYGTRPRAPRAAAALHCPGGRAPLRNPLAPDNGAWTEYAAAQKRLQAFRATESCGSGAELIDFVY